jgi:hypothetical protein
MRYANFMYLLSLYLLLYFNACFNFGIYLYSLQSIFIPILTCGFAHHKYFLNQLKTFDSFSEICLNQLLNMFNLHKWLPCFAAAASRRQLSSILNTTHQRHFLLPECVPQNNGSRRHYPLQGTKPKTRWFFDFNHLNELTGGEYTHDPLRLRRLGGRNPETRMKVCLN